MSRCYPFPPTGYVRNCSWSHNDALIFSIKLQRENDKAISDKGVEKVKSSDRKTDKPSEKKDSKKDKKDEKREKLKLRSAVDGEKQMCIDKLYKAEKTLSETKGQQGLHQHGVELLERSNLTEEHGRPVESQNASCSSDSTSNSTKRKRHLSPANTIQCSGGNIFRIRLSSSQRGDEHSTSGSKVQLPSQNRHDRQSFSTVRPCSILTKTEPPIKQKEAMLRDQVTSCLVPTKQKEAMCRDQVSSCLVPTKKKEVMLRDQVSSCLVLTSTATMQMVARKDKEQICSLQDKKLSSLPQIKDLSSTAQFDSIDLKKKISSHEKKMRKRESLCNSLFKNMAPPTFEVNQITDEDWLFGRMDDEAPAKRLKGTDASQGCADSLPCSASGALQPHASFLSDVGIYALPFTVPI